MTLETVSSSSRNTIYVYQLIWAIRGTATVASTGIHGALCNTRKESVNSISSRFYMKHPNWCKTQMFNNNVFNHMQHTLFANVYYLATIFDPSKGHHQAIVQEHEWKQTYAFILLYYT